MCCGCADPDMSFMRVRNVVRLSWVCGSWYVCRACADPGMSVVGVRILVCLFVRIL